MNKTPDIETPSADPPEPSALALAQASVKATPAMQSELHAIAQQHSQPKAAAAALRTLYEFASPKLYPYVLRIVLRPEWAEEVLQESFIKVWSQAASYNPEKAAPMTWVTTIARNTAFDLLRRSEQDRAQVDINDPLFDESRIEQAQALSASSNYANPADQWALSQDATQLARCFAKLDAHTRQAIGLAFYQDLSHAEIAKALNEPLGTVKAWVRRGLAKLNTCLGAIGYQSSANTRSTS